MWAECSILTVVEKCVWGYNDKKSVQGGDDHAHKRTKYISGEESLC